MQDETLHWLYLTSVSSAAAAAAAVKTILRHLNGTAGKGIVVKSSDTNLKLGFCVGSDFCDLDKFGKILNDMFTKAFTFQSSFHCSLTDWMANSRRRQTTRPS